MLPSEEMMNEKQENQESEIDPNSTHPHEDHHPSHFNNDLQNEESTISADETEDQKSRGEGELQESELKYMLSKVEEKGKRPMSESYELKSINKPIFSNLERGGTSENESMKEDEYDYDQDLAIL